MLAPMPPSDSDWIVTESTYGDREHAHDGLESQLRGVLRRVAARGGVVVIPAFAVGRTQELIYVTHELVRAGQIPRIPVIIDSPLATEATQVFARHADLFDPGEEFVRQFRENPAATLGNSLIEYTETPQASKEAMQRRGPMVIIAASGMAESGRILHHLLHGASDTRNTVLIVGFQAEHTLGRRIVERRPTIKVFGEEVPLQARVEVLNGYSAHADRHELTAWAEAVRRTSPRLQHIWLVHGEPDAQDALASELNRREMRVSCPARGTRVKC